MNKDELKVAFGKKHPNLTNRAIDEFFETLFDGRTGLIARELKRGGTVVLSGFGSFAGRKRRSRVVQNPQDRSKLIKVPAKRVPGFRPGVTLKAFLNGK